MSIRPSVVTEAMDMDTEAHSCIKDKAKEEVRTLGCRLGPYTIMALGAKRAFNLC